MTETIERTPDVESGQAFKVIEDDIADTDGGDPNFRAIGFATYSLMCFFAAILWSAFAGEASFLGIITYALLLAATVFGLASLVVIVVAKPEKRQGICCAVTMGLFATILGIFGCINAVSIQAYP